MTYFAPKCQAVPTRHASALEAGGGVVQLLDEQSAVPPGDLGHGCLDGAAVENSHNLCEFSDIGSVCEVKPLRPPHVRRGSQPTPGGDLCKHSLHKLKELLTVTEGARRRVS